MGSFVCLKSVGLVNALPKTRSGKVMRATIQAVANSAPFRVPATIDNVAVLDDIREVLLELGYAKKMSVVDGKLCVTFSKAEDRHTHKLPYCSKISFPSISPLTPMTTDSAFLAELEDFLVSFDLPTFLTLHSLDGDEDTAEVPPVQAALTPAKPIVCAAVRTRRRRKKKQPMDTAAKLEMMREKERKRRSAYRAREKAERENLQKQVEELSAEVMGLQTANQTDNTLASTAWKMVAKRELQARVDAEEKQHRLIKAVEYQAEVIKEFNCFFHDHLSVVDDMGEKKKRIRVEPSDAEMYKIFADELDAFHLQTEDVFKAYELDSTESNWDRPTRKWKEEGANGYYVFADKQVMPFDLQRVCKFTWEVAQLNHRQEDREHYDEMGDPENTSAFKFRITTRLSSGKNVSLLQRLIARRYIQEDRFAVVWRSFTEGEGIFSGMHADECGWCVSIPLPSSPKPKTLMRTLIRHVPMHFSTKATHESEVQQFTGLVLDTGTEDATEIANLMEKLLLRDNLCFSLILLFPPWEASDLRRHASLRLRPRLSENSTATPPAPVNDEPCQDANVLWCNQNGAFPDYSRIFADASGRQSAVSLFKTN
ncbi:unnamed protein product [Phytophthora fragariaefolia]|uniref:Unnamed protein product n=1 Tax=Phytophthora fragariaefolia TaxID=1490495 RepID=A0A9W6XHE7_9STRA|nr:unnamed protein product [Phytophthora fragariaefolia]